ncbi:RIBOSOME ASSEMBLY FACTOR MRT4 [Salix koriyanagi]|uniref:RIBOSOME ASSEMBLY FACTOR MRT4 n=1 Tax=Salix koriyanagi TaxID=2511006 RepID=A0A9Q0ZAZ3_9ROSI|nr:RIBOSOME ASSEMBLY FACTOR MRT4 [Salix koriyanagi]
MQMKSGQVFTKFLSFYVVILDFFLPTCQEKKLKGCLMSMRNMTLQGQGPRQQKWWNLRKVPLEQFTHEMEPFLRKQGLPVRLNKGVIELVSDFVVCEEGKPLSPESARILRLLGTKMATFRLHLICRWSPEDFELYREGLDESGVESA